MNAEDVIFDVEVDLEFDALAEGISHSFVELGAVELSGKVGHQHALSSQVLTQLSPIV